MEKKLPSCIFKSMASLELFLCLNQYENVFFTSFRAIKKFTAGIKVDPTYVRAYVCRGEAYHKIHDVSTQLLQQMCSNL